MRASRLIVLAAAPLRRCSPPAAATSEEVRTLGETEGLYLDVGELKYQIQISRYLNPSDVEDRAYLAGLPAGHGASPPGDETWFGVFLRVAERDGRDDRAGQRLRDRRHAGERVPADPAGPKVNPFAYQPDPIAPKGLIPQPDSVASEGVIQGSLLLFKVKTASLQNRPLEFRFRRGSGVTGIVDLDV